jgi:hypothetical protein
MEDTTYLSTIELDSPTALKTLVKKHHQFLTEQKKIKVFRLFFHAKNDLCLWYLYVCHNL